MKNIGGKVLTALLLLCSFGVSAQDAPLLASEPVASEVASTPQKLNLWLHLPSEARAPFERLLAEFENQTGIRVQSTYIQPDFISRLQKAAQTQTQPDLILDDAAMLGNFVQHDSIAPIDRSEIDPEQRLYDLAWESARGMDGTYYAVPFSAQTYALFVRKDWRTKLSISLPKTRQELDALARAFAEKDPDGDGKADTFGMLIPRVSAQSYSSALISTWFWQNGAQIIRPNSKGGYKPALDEPAASDALRSLRSMICNKSTQPSTINLSQTQALELFRTHQAGAVFSASYPLARFDRDLGKATYEVIPFLLGTKNSAVLAEGSSLYLTKASKNKESAKAFMVFMTSQAAQEMAIKTSREQTDSLSAIRLSVNKKIEPKTLYNDERMELFQEIYARQGRYAPPLPDWNPLMQLLSQGFNQILGDCTLLIEPTLKSLNTKLSDELAKQGALAK